MARISAVSVALSLVVMIVAVSVMSGFKNRLKDKISGFNSHIRILNYDSNFSLEPSPILNDYYFLDSIAGIPEVKHIQQYALKGGIIKTDNEIQGIILKGISSDYDWSFFDIFLTDGSTFAVNDTAATNSVLISETLSKLLNLKVNDSFEVYFVQEPVRVRKFTVSGLYNTYFEDMDRNFVLCDIKHIRRLNRWNDQMASGLEIMCRSLDQMDKAAEKIKDIAAYRTFDDGSQLNVITIRDSFPQIFNWLAIMDTNVLIILIIMLAVAGFNMVSGLLIMLLEKISMIGTLKALGMKDADVRLIFLYRSSVIVLRGLIWGNITGTALCLVQQKYSLLKLDPDSYYFAAVPVEVDFLNILIINICTFAFISFVQILPVIAITGVSPAQTVKAE